MVLPRRVWDYIRCLGSSEQVSADIRGWRFDMVSPRYRYHPTVSEVTSYCPTHRDLYLRRVQGIRVEEKHRGAVFGLVAHEVFLHPFRLVDRGVHDVEALAAARRRLLRELGVRGDRFMEEVYNLGVALALQSLVDGGIPLRVEPQIPGAPVGLSDVVKPDLLVGFIPLEVTTAHPDSLYGRRKELAVAGYALALEAWTGVPVDYGVVIYLRERDGGPWLEWRVVVVDDSLRRRFLRERDEVAMIVDDSVDPGPGDECPEWCPYRVVCRGEGGGRS